MSDQHLRRPRRARCGELYGCASVGGAFTGFVLDLRNDAGAARRGDRRRQRIPRSWYGDDGTRCIGEPAHDAPPNGDLIRATPLCCADQWRLGIGTEIVAGAAGHRRATVLGTHSFGKGRCGASFRSRAARRPTTRLLPRRRANRSGTRHHRRWCCPEGPGRQRGRDLESDLFAVEGDRHPGAAQPCRSEARPGPAATGDADHPANSRSSVPHRMPSHAATPGSVPIRPPRGSEGYGTRSYPVVAAAIAWVIAWHTCCRLSPSGSPAISPCSKRQFGDGARGLFRCRPSDPICHFIRHGRRIRHRRRSSSTN